MVITLANQKGGVGKSTVTMLLANWLTARNHSVLVLDVDAQSTITNQRTRDKESFNSQEFFYEVIPFDIKQPIEDIAQVLTILSEDNKGTFIIADAPGNLSDNGLIPFLTLADVIICPFQYERKSLDSTGTFMLVLQKLLEKYSKGTTQIYLPNRVKLGTGTKAEKEEFAKIEEVFKRYGLVAPILRELQCLARVNSISLNKEQDQAVVECFNWIYTEICETKKSI